MPLPKATLLCCCCCLALLCALAAAAPPLSGARVSVSKGMIVYAKDKMLPVILKSIDDLEIPDVSDTVTTPIGKVKFTLSKIDIQKIEVGPQTVQLTTSGGVNVIASQINVTIKLNWAYSQALVADKGEVTAVTTDTRGAVTVVFGATKEGKPTIQVSFCSIEIGSMDITVKGGASWVYNSITYLFQSTIKKAVQKVIEQQITQKVGTLVQAKLDSAPVTVNVFKSVYVDYHITEPGVVLKDFLALGLQAEVYSTVNRKPTPGAPQMYLPFTVPEGAGKMVQAIVSEWSATSVTNALFNSGLMTTLLTKNNFSIAALKPYFNTAAFKTMIPMLYDQYRNAELQYFVDTAFAQPQVQITKASPNVIATFPVTLSVRVWNEFANRFDEAFVLLIKERAEANLKLEGKLITSSLENADTSITTVKSDIGPIDTAPLEMLVNFLMTGALAQGNDLLGKGIPLPDIKGVDLVDPTIKFYDGWLAILTDVDIKF